MKAVAVYCVDGRLESTRERVRAFLPTLGYEIPEGNLYGITKPGPDATCSGLRGDLHAASVNEDIALLLDRGVALNVVVIVAHAECAGHPVDADTHEKDVATSAEKLHAQFKLPVVSLFDAKTDAGWELKLCAHLA
jgi:hypothetical protein